MPEEQTLNVNGKRHSLVVDPETPLLYVLRGELGLKGPKYGCGEEQCGACKVLVDGAAVPSCQLPVSHVRDAEIVTVEGLGTADDPHPLQETFVEEQAAQCGFCSAGMVISAQGLLNRVRYPTDEQIREALYDNLCRCGVYDRIRRAIQLRIGRAESEPIYEVRQMPALDHDAPASAERPASLHRTPDLDAWLRINTDGTITVFSGKAELGQGIQTALVQIAAEELGVALERIRLVSADTGRTPNEGGTVGSMSVETSGAAIRFAAAAARHHLLSMAHTQLKTTTPLDDLDVVDGSIIDPNTGRETTYWDLMGGKRFNLQVTAQTTPRPPSQYNLVGKPVKRLDLLKKLTGGASYVHDIEMPGMLHARVVRPPGYHARLVGFDMELVMELPGVVNVVRDGNFLAVVAEGEAQAVRALERAQEIAEWEYQKEIPPEASTFEDLRSKPAQSNLVVNGITVNDPIPEIQEPSEAAQTRKATYFRPYHMHGSLGPSAAVAQWQNDELTLWSHTQNVFALRGSIAQVLGINPEQVRVIHREGAGCYGHNGADDVALDAALVARENPGRPIMLKWMRADEHGWEPYGSAMVMQLQASLDMEGTVIDWNHDVWSYTHSTRPHAGESESGLLAAWYVEDAFPPQTSRPSGGYHSGTHRNADPLYNFARRRVVRHEAVDSPLRVSAMRSLGAYGNAFAIESFMDELALVAGIDPLDFRLKHLDDVRAKAVLEAAAEKSGWQGRSRSTEDGHGWGLALTRYKNRQCYAAIVAQVDVNRETGVIHLRRAVIAADAGLVINPDGLSNQLEGGFVQAASWTLYEKVRFDAHGITSLDWESYPIMRSTDAPVIQTVLLNRPDQPSLGAGEATQNPTPAAIANAVYDAVGVRLREIPFTPDKVKATLSGR